MPVWKPSLAKIPAAIQRYGLAVLSVAIALGSALLLTRYQFRGVEFPLFLFAIALTVWYADIGPWLVESRWSTCQSCNDFSVWKKSIIALLLICRTSR